MPRLLVIFSSLALALSLFFIAAETQPAFAQDTAESEGEEEAIVPFALPKDGPFHPENIEIKNNDAISDWYRSSHADAAAEAFRHWDGEEEINPVCSVCHSGEGFRAFHGLDGSEPGVPDAPIPTGGVVDCGTCHNPGLAEIKEITFPSGLSHPVQGVEAACMTCHQGRTAGITVEKAIDGKSLDETDGELRFVNPHYATAAATWLGGYGGAGYHYQGQDYSGRFFHAQPVSTCNSCHDPHSLEIEFEPCMTCHQGESPADIRIARQSYDGSGDTDKGIKSDIEANAAMLLDMIRTYAEEVIEVPIIYDGHSYPYFFADANGDGAVDQSEGSSVAYNAWSPRLLRAAYNWKLVTADPGAFAHNPVYSLELLHDSMADLGGPLGIDISELGIRR